MSNPPNLPRVVTTGAGEYPATAFPKLDQSDQALRAYAASLEDRLAVLERYNVATLGTLGQVTTDNQALAYSLRSSVWSAAAPLGSVLNIYNVSGLTVEAADVMARDVNGVPTRIIVAMRNLASTGTNSCWIAVFSYDPATNALALTSGVVGYMTGTSASIGNNYNVLALAATGPTTARILVEYTVANSYTSVGYIQDVTCDAAGANISLSPVINAASRPNYYSAVVIPKNRNRRGYLVGQNTLVYPSATSLYQGRYTDSSNGASGFAGFSRLWRGAGDGNVIPNPVGQTWSYSSEIAVDYLGNGRFAALGITSLLGVGGRAVVRTVAVDDAKVEAREVVLPYTLNTLHGVYAMSGGVLLAKLWDGNFNRTCAVVVNADGSLAAPSNGEDHSGIFANNAWQFGLQFKPDTMAVLTYNTGFSHTLSYVKADTSKTGSDPILTQSPAAGAAFNLNIGAGGTSVALGACIKLSTNPASDDFLFIGAGSGTGGYAFAAAVRLAGA